MLCPLHMHMVVPLRGNEGVSLTLLAALGTLFFLLVASSCLDMRVCT